MTELEKQLLGALEYAIKQVPELATVPGIAAAIAATEAGCSQPVSSQAEHNLIDVRCGCCGYFTYQREHMGCIRAAHRPATPPNQPVAVPEPKVGRTSDPLKLAYWDGWNECRAAMLSAAQQTEGGE